MIHKCRFTDRKCEGTGYTERGHERESERGGLHPLMELLILPN